MPSLAVAGVVLAFVLLLTLHLRIGRLPRALHAVARKERTQEGGALLDAMKEAVATRSGQAVIALQAHQDQLAQSLRAQVAEAEARARAAEHRAADTEASLGKAFVVLCELRTTLDTAWTVIRELDALLQRVPVATGPQAARRPEPAAPATTRRELAETIPDPEGDFDDDDEMTRVAERPVIVATSRIPAASRERTSARSITPPGSSRPLPPVPGIVAASLGPRPDGGRHSTPRPPAGNPAPRAPAEAPEPRRAPPDRPFAGTGPTMPSMTTVREQGCPPHRTGAS
jgi:hypothetical protein